MKGGGNGSGECGRPRTRQKSDCGVGWSKDRWRPWPHRRCRRRELQLSSSSHSPKWPESNMLSYFTFPVSSGSACLKCRKCSASCGQRGDLRLIAKQPQNRPEGWFGSPGRTERVTVLVDGVCLKDSVLSLGAEARIYNSTNALGKPSDTLSTESNRRVVSSTPCMDQRHRERARCSSNNSIPNRSLSALTGRGHFSRSKDITPTCSDILFRCKIKWTTVSHCVCVCVWKGNFYSPISLLLKLFTVIYSLNESHDLPGAL